MASMSNSRLTVRLELEEPEWKKMKRALKTAGITAAALCLKHPYARRRSRHMHLSQITCPQASDVSMAKHRDPYERERERALAGGGLTGGIALTLILLALGLCAVVFVYWRG